jgi:Lar family restriction alleviation protein
MTEPDLKPCPFCGGSVSIGISDEGTTGAIECAKGSSCIGSGLLIGFMKSDQETAISAWNSRAVDPAAIREAALREAAEALSNLADHALTALAYEHAQACREEILELLGEKE